MVNKNTKLSLIVCTCDKYSFLWSGLFQLFSKYWPTIPNNIIGLQETKYFKYGSYNLEPIGNGFFSNRLKRALNKIDTNYVMLYIEDHYLENFVNQSILHEAISILDSDKKVGMIKLFNYKCAQKAYNEHFNQVTNQNYKISIGPQIWRCKYLKKILRNNEDVWMTEYYGNLRSKFMSEIVLQVNSPMYNVFPITFGGLLVKGKIQEKLRIYFEEKENIYIDYTEPRELEKSKKTIHSIFKRSFIRFIKNRLLILYHVLKPR